MKIRNLTDLFIHELMDMHSAENLLLDALKKMKETARNKDLKRAFETHELETAHHVTRIQEILDILGLTRKDVTCRAIESLIKESEAITKDAADDRALDAALIAVAQKIEHHEIASYGTLIALARTLGYDNAVVILKQTLEEERECDSKLTHLAVDDGINREALKRAA